MEKEFIDKNKTNVIIFIALLTTTTLIFFITITILDDIREFALIIFTVQTLIAIFSLLYLKNKYSNDLEIQYKLISKNITKKTNKLQTEMNELQIVNKNLYDIAHTDFLTQTMNRRNFFIHAQKHFANAKKTNEILSVVMIDIDNFKKFNDKYGHHIGDKVLIHFAQIIKSNITEKTIFGRLGGEEFALLINHTTLEDAIIKAEKLKKKVEEIELIVDDKVLKITASFGVSDSINCSNIDDMLQKADTLLYKAKESGRNLVRSRLNLC